MGVCGEVFHIDWMKSCDMTTTKMNGVFLDTAEHGSWLDGFKFSFGGCSRGQVFFLCCYFTASYQIMILSAECSLYGTVNTCDCVGSFLRGVGCDLTRIVVCRSKVPIRHPLPCQEKSLASRIPQLRRHIRDASSTGS